MKHTHAAKIVIGKRLLVPKSILPPKALRSRYKIELYNEKMCKECENLPDRGNELCRTCEGEIARYKLYKEHSPEYWSLPQGDYHSLLNVLDKKKIKYEFIDKRKKIPFKHNIQFTGELFGKDYVDANGYPRTNQRKLVKRWMSIRHGMIRAKPRSGKCLIGDTIINNGMGWLELQEIIQQDGYHPVNDIVTNHRGTERVSHYYKDKSKTIYIETANGITIECTPEHPLRVLTKNLKFKWRRADKLKPGDMIVSKDRNHKPIWGTRNDVSIAEAKLIGYLIANGRLAGFSSSDPVVVKDFIKSAKLLFGKNVRIRVEQETGKTPNYHIVGHTPYMQKRGWYFTEGSRGKSIPRIIREAPREIVQACLNAYFACDSHNNGQHINLVTASNKLSKQLQTLLYMGFGIRNMRVAMNKQAHNSSTPTIRKYWNVSITGQYSKLFVTLFPDSKVAKYQKRLHLETSGNDIYRDPMPPLRQFIAKVYNDAFTGQLYGNQRLFQYRNGEVKTYRSIFGPNPLSRKLLSRYKLDQLDWTDQLEDLRKLNKSAFKTLKRYLKIQPDIEIVTKVKKKNKVVPVYDLTVPNSHAFYANGLLSHNTVMAAKIICSLGQKTIILANRFELLKQFYKTFMGDKTRGRKPMSNIPQLKRKTNREIIRLALKASDLKNLDGVDILLVNYQKYVRDPEKFARLVNGNFSVLTVDEAHGAGAQGYLRVVANCDVRHRLSLTATPRRKDNRHILIQRIMGPVVASSKTVSLIPEIVFKQSQFSPPRLYKMWNHALAWISSNIDMQKELVRQAFADLRNGHEVIIIPLDRKKQIDQLVKMINHQAKVNRMKKKEKWPKNLAIKYYDGVDRDDVLDEVDKAGPTILVAMRSMIKEGIDFQRPSMLYVYVPMSASIDKATGAPALEQLAMRVCTPYKKPRPMVRIWVHNVSFFKSCIAGLFWQEIWPNRSGQGEGKYSVSKMAFEQAKDLRVKKNAPANKDTFSW